MQAAPSVVAEFPPQEIDGSLRVYTNQVGAPLILQETSDGCFTYDTTELAAAYYRLKVRRRFGDP